MRDVRGDRRGWYAVVVLGGLYIVACVDRLILNLMVEPLRHDLHIDDTQVSLLMGAAFAVFFAVVGLPLGRAADIGNRKWLIVSAAVVWGVCTLGSGLAGTFWLLCALRIGVAIGEAALTPASLSLICDLFPPERRAHASSVYMAFGATGATGSYILGGMAVNAAAGLPRIVLPLTGLVRPWQAVFLAVGAPALVLAAVVALTVKEPRRDSAPASPGLTFAWIRKPYAPVFLMFIAAAIGQVIVYGLGGWAPTYLVRRFHWAAGDAGICVGLISMVVAVSGMLLSPRIAEAWSARGRTDAPNLVLAGGLLLGFPLVVAAALSPSAVGFLTFFGAGMIFIMGTGVMPFICVQWAVPSRLRGEMLAAGLMGNALTGIALGPTAVVLAARLLPGDQASHLGGGIAVVAAVCGPLAAACVLALRKPMAGLMAARGEEMAPGPSQPPAAAPAVAGAV